jgi:glutamate dehydrogenase/leucine dehydrogenase
MVNISTKDEQIARAKRGKEKDYLVKALLHYANNELTHGIKNLIDCEGCANYLIDNLGYRKINENEVVISKEEWQQIKSSLYYSKEELEKKLDKARKETANKFLNMIYWKAVKHIKGKNKDECFIEISFEKLDKIAKEFGVDLGE